MNRPSPDEYAPYYDTYVRQVPDGPILGTLESQLGETTRLLAGLGEERASFRYAPDKWSLKEVVGHVIDAERLFLFRALWFARRDPSPQPGMDQDAWEAAAGHDLQPIAHLLDELAAVRAGTITFYRGLTDDEGMRRGVANDCEFTVRALAWVIAGHERHHRKVIEERYLAEG